MQIVNIEELLGKTLKSVTMGDDKEEILFITNDDVTYKMFHQQSCCESVSVEDICGELDWLVGSEIITAREDGNEELERKDKYDESWTWTFYNIATAKGHVTIRWYGTSNGYYSESVDIARLPTENELQELEKFVVRNTILNERYKQYVGHRLHNPLPIRDYIEWDWHYINKLWEESR